MSRALLFFGMLPYVGLLNNLSIGVFRIGIRVALGPTLHTLQFGLGFYTLTFGLRREMHLEIASSPAPSQEARDAA